MRIKLLSGIEIVGPGGPVEIASTRQRIILMLMLLECNRVVPIERLIDAVWGENPPATARGQIQICVSMVRRALARAGIPPFLVTDTAGYVCRVVDDELDVMVFHRLVRDGRQAVLENRLAEADRLFAAAIDLWDGGAPMGGLSRTMDAIVLRLVEQRVSLLEEWADVRLQLGHQDCLIDQLTAAVGQFPLRERLRGKLMLALYRSGRQAEALSVYREGRSMLVEELGVEPGPELRAAEHAILVGTPETEPHPDAAAPARPSDDGAAAGAAPGPVTVPRTLPNDIADFTGRADVLGDLRGRLLDPAGPETCGVPVTVISGRGGVGKTAVAVHAAHRHRADFPDGQLYLDLHDPSGEPVAPHSALHRLLRATGVPADAVPEGLEERAEMFRHRVADRRLLVVLDDAHSEEQIIRLLPGTVRCRVIVTSRLCLTGIPGARQIRMEPLGEPEALAMLAGFLGADRVGAERAASRRLVRLCTGLPLAIRVAAARLLARPHWTVRGFTDRLSDEGRRLDELSHRGLGVRAGLDRTYGTLPPPAQRLFRRLSLFGGAPFGSWLAGPLLGMEYRAAEDLLETLVDTSLVDVEQVHAGHNVYRLHGLTQPYARERLALDESARHRSAALERVLSCWLSLAGETHESRPGRFFDLGRAPVPSWGPPRAAITDAAAPAAGHESDHGAIRSAVRLAAEVGPGEACSALAVRAGALIDAAGVPLRVTAGPTRWAAVLPGLSLSAPLPQWRLM